MLFSLIRLSRFACLGPNRVIEFVLRKMNASVTLEKC